jgi:hypothetical protein
MNGLEAVLIIVVLFVLRFALPLALAYGVCCGLNRLQARLDA